LTEFLIRPKVLGNSILLPRLRKDTLVGFRSHSAVPFAVSTAPAFPAGPQLGQNS